MSGQALSSTFVVRNALLASKLAKRAGVRLSAHGISLSEYLVMDYLDASPRKAVPRVELAEHLGMSASGVTRLVAPMEKNHILEKEINPRDARQSLVKLTATGQTLFNETSASFEHIAGDLVSRLSENQLKKLLELYEQLL